MAYGFKCIYQRDSMQCGIACLAMICRHFGKNCSVDSISQICHASAEGLSMLAISQAAEKLGLQAAGARLSIERLNDCPLPCILHWQQRHFVVLFKIKNGRYYIADPAKGISKISQRQFEEGWISCRNDDNEPAGVAMFFNPTPRFFATSSRLGDNDDSRSLRFYLSYISKYRNHFTATILALIAGSLLQLALPILTQKIVDVGIKNQDLGFIGLILLAQLMITVSRTAIDFVRRWILLKIGMNINIALLCDFFDKLLRLPMAIFDTKATGDLIQRMSDHSRVNSFITQDTLNTTFAAFSFVAFSVVLAFYNIGVFAIFLVGSAIYALWLAIFLRRRKVLDYELFDKKANDSNKTFEFLSAMQEIKLQNCENRRLDEWKKIQTDLFAIQTKILRLNQTQEAGCIFINEMKNIVITVAAASAVIEGSMTLGMMLAVQYIIGQLSAPVERLMSLLYSMQDVNISLERINEVRRIDDENASSDLAESIINPDKGITFSGVSFRYDPHAISETISNIDLHIPHGKVTAIVGASGSGKTTLLKLLLGYYPVEQGKINIGDTDLAVLNKKWWRNECGVVMQDGVIFSESIARNIAVDDNDIDIERMTYAAKLACIHDYISSLPLKYNTRIGRDGTGLSVGQKQRILIARAVYRNPQYIFLDEATNSLDANSERAIVENLDNFYQDKTVVVIAHRLSTVRNAHQIVVIDGGKVVERGNHQSLTAQHGAYYNLVKNQLELGN
ncbi:MAG: peptidase domain-containing ABC transporter [Muribaculaceae bacterium]